MRIKPLFSSLFAAGLCCSFVGCGGSEADLPPVSPVSNPGYDDDAPTDLAVQSNNTLAVELYQRLAKEDADGGNLFFSPASISGALMLTYEGSRGQTQGEFEKILSLPEGDRTATHKGYAGMLNRYGDGIEAYELSVSNAVWTEQTLPLRNEFVDTLKQHYEAGFESVDFKSDFENQRKRINGWVEKRTKERIKDLLPANALNEMTRLVLVNAIYFKGKWALDFEEHATKDEPFYLLSNEAEAKGKSVKTPLMRQGGERFNHGDFDGYDALQMKYKGRDLSMLVLLPDERGGLPALEAKLSTEMIALTVEKMESKRVNLRLPKWEMTLEYDLIPTMKAMGLNSAFAADTADFTGMSDSAEAELLYISAIRHKAFIAVDEAGTEAAAATAVLLKEESAAFNPDRPIDFRADHPFIYFIQDDRTGAILFMGRVTDPS